MTRPRSQTVEYFPHMANHGKTMHSIEGRFGNDGYTFWFKLLELLAQAEGHYIDMNVKADWLFLQSRTRLSEEICQEMLDMLSDLDAIDPELWHVRVVWCQKFIDNVTHVYRNRRVDNPRRPDNYTQKPASNGITTRRNPQREGKGGKVGKVLNAPDVGGYPPSFVSFWEEYPKKVGKGAAFTAFKKAKVKLETLLTAVAEQKGSEDWLKEGGRYIPMPTTWLNQRRWEDELPNRSNGGAPSAADSGFKEIT